MSSTESCLTRLQLVKQLLYDKCDIAFTDLELNKKSVAYCACSFKLNGHKIEYRVSKITPTKVGQFVTVWKRNEIGITVPFDIADDIDFIVVTSENGENLGQFIFPGSVLVNKCIMSQKGKKGKRGIRVYPPWDIVASNQALNTQRWQNEYFVKLKPNIDIDFERVKKLFEEK